MQGKTVLLVEDEAAIVDVVRRYLERDGYRVMVASDGQRAVDEFQRLRPDLVLLDLMLPGLDGWEVCRRIRQDGSTPVIMLTARDEEADKLIGLELGADDYITKPFSPREVVARVRAVLRRARGARPAGFRLLFPRPRHPGRVFTRLQLLDEVQGYAFEGYERTIDAHIKNIRQKLEPDPRKPRHILTVHRVGYRLAEDGRA